MKKIANILDFPKSSLEPAIWNSGSVLKPEIKKFIMDFIESFAQANNFKDTFAWIDDVKIVGSLTTNCYNSNSDMDIHIVVNLPKFVEIEHPEMSEKEASDYLDGIRKQVDQVKAKVPNTEHPTEIYFENKFTTIASQEFSGTYSVLNDAWIKYPHIVDQTFDIEKLHPDLLNLAKETASELDAAFGEIKRDVSDIKDLQETINDWPVEQRSLFEKKLQKRLDELETEIKGLVDLREDVAEKRKHYKALSEQEVRFKYLQKYFYMHVLTDLKTLLKQSPDLSMKDIPVVENIMQQASLNKKEAAMGFGMWMSPQGEIVDISSHPNYAFDNAKELGLQNIPEQITEENSGEIYASLMEQMFQKGWVRLRLMSRELDVELYDLEAIPDMINNFIIEHPTEQIRVANVWGDDVSVNYDDVISKGIQEAVNRANRELEDVASLKQTASKHEDSAEGRICIDFDQTIAEDSKNGTIGVPEPNAKAAIEKLKADGWYIIIFSHRSTTEYGEDQIKEFLDKYDIPYDEIYTEKPNAEFFVDDRAITFTTWDDVLKKVDTSHLSEKEASLSVTSFERTHPAFWIDPSGIKYPVDTTHEDWFFENEKLLKDKYGYGQDSVGQSWWDIKTVNLLRQMLEDGWVRIGDLFGSGRKFLGNGVEIADLSHIPNSVFEYASNFGPGAYLMIEDLRRRWVELEVSALLEGGQEAVDYALKQQNAANRAITTALNLPVVDPKTFNRKEPYALFIGTQRFPPDIALDLFDVFGEHPMITESNARPTVTLDTLIKEHIPVIGKSPRAGDKQPAQDLSGVMKTAAFPSGNWAESAWISPEGEVIDTEGVSHEDAIFELLDDEKKYDSEDINTLAISKGWTRFGEMGGGGDTGANVKSLRNINPAVFNHALKYTGQNKEMVVADLSGKYVHMPVDEFVLGQKAVNKAIQVQKTAKLGSSYDFSSTHFLLPKELSEKIIRWAMETIPESQIVYDEKDPGTKGIQLDSHITLKYGLKTDDFEEIKKVLEGEKAPHIKFGKTSFFEPEGKDYDVVIIPVESDDLQKLNEKLCSQVEHEDLQFKEYHPHVTVAYITKGSGVKYEGIDILESEELTLPVLIFSPKSGERRELELKKTASFYKIGDVVKDLSNGKIGIVREINHGIATLEEI